MQQDQYYNATATGEVPYDATAEQAAYDLSQMDPEQRAQLEEEWRTELAKTEEEINTLRQVLASKTKSAADLKKKLGITTLNQWTSDLGAGFKNLQETTALGGVTSTLGTYTAPAYQKTGEALKGVGEKTSSLFGGFGFVSKLGEVKNTNAFKSFEATVGSVKSKMTGSRSNSTNSFEEALNSMEQQRAAQAQQDVPAAQ